MRKIAVILGSWAHRRSTITFRDLGPNYDVTVIAGKSMAYQGKTDLLLPVQQLTALRDVVRHIPKVRNMFGWGADQYLFGLEQALADFDVVLSSSPTCLYSYQAARYCEKTGKPLVLQEIEIIPFKDKYRRIYYHRHYALSAAKRTVGATERAKTSLMLEGVPPEKICHIPFGIDTEFFHPRVKEASLHEDLGLARDHTVILFAGRITWEKGVFDIVHAAKLLIQDPEVRKHNPKFIVVGGGPDTHTLKERIAFLGLSDTIQVVSGVPFNRMPNLYATADMLVAPSIPTKDWLEQWGLVLSEAMAVGVPVISTYSGAIPEVVGDSGILVQPCDPLSLLDAIKRMIMDKDLRVHLSQSGRDRVVALYDWRIVGKMYADLIDEVFAE